MLENFLRAIANKPPLRSEVPSLPADSLFGYEEQLREAASDIYTHLDTLAATIQLLPSALSRVGHIALSVHEAFLNSQISQGRLSEAQGQNFDWPMSLPAIFGGCGPIVLPDENSRSVEVSRPRIEVRRDPFAEAAMGLYVTCGAVADGISNMPVHMHMAFLSGPSGVGPQWHNMVRTTVTSSLDELFDAARARRSMWG